MTNRKSQVINFRLDKKTYLQLLDVCETQKQSVSDMIRAFLDRGIKNASKIKAKNNKSA